MKLYSDTLTVRQLGDATPNGVFLEAEPITAPRVRSQGWKVTLSCFDNRRSKNSGTHGAATWKAPAATWDQHGEWMATLFGLDPNMRVAHYDGVADFHRKTDDKYKTTEGAAA